MTYPPADISICSTSALSTPSAPRAAFYKTVKVNGQEYSLKLVDTAGQDEYSVFPQMYAMDMHGYVFVYR